jgi:hypothetical protein
LLIPDWGFGSDSRVPDLQVWNSEFKPWFHKTESCEYLFYDLACNLS